MSGINEDKNSPNNSVEENDSSTPPDDKPVELVVGKNNEDLKKEQLNKCGSESSSSSNAEAEDRLNGAERDQNVKGSAGESESSGKSTENASCTSTVRQTLQPTKRRPEKELNHLNWDQEEEPEEKGEFVKASADQLKSRKILTAKRKQKTAGESSGNPFGAITLASGFGGFSSGGTSNNMFSFTGPQPQAITVPKFDFNSTSNNEVPDAKDTSKSPNTTSTKKLKIEDELTATSPEGVNSATTA